MIAWNRAQRPTPSRIPVQGVALRERGTRLRKAVTAVAAAVATGVSLATSCRTFAWYLARSPFIEALVFVGNFRGCAFKSVQRCVHEQRLGNVTSETQATRRLLRIETPLQFHTVAGVSRHRTTKRFRSNDQSQASLSGRECQGRLSAQVCKACSHRVESRCTSAEQTRQPQQLQRAIRRKLGTRSGSNSTRGSGRRGAGSEPIATKPSSDVQHQRASKRALVSGKGSVSPHARSGAAPVR